MSWAHLIVVMVASFSDASFAAAAKTQAATPTISSATSTSNARRYHEPRHPSPRIKTEKQLQQKQQQHQPVRSLQQGQQQNGSVAAQLRQDLLANYDKGSFPWELVWNAETTSDAENVVTEDGDGNVIRTGLPIELGINFHKVLNVDITMSEVDLIVWVRQQWQDPRLAWDPADYNGMDKTWFWIGDGTGPGGETSEIWTPDLELWNLETSLSETLTDAHAAVSSDGTVFWSRPGHLKAVCKFEGLAHFPYDTLKCTMEVGSWGYSGLYLRPTMMDGTGYSIGGSETAGEAYAEYSIQEVSAEEHIYPPYPGAAEEDWPVLFYHIAFQRAYQPYARGFLVLQIVLNFAAFSCFWLPPHCGERMGLAITAVLAAVASELVISASLPQAAEITWFAKFSIGSLMFATLALFESAVVIYFYHYSGDDLTPTCLKWLMERGQQQLQASRQKTEAGPNSTDQMEPTLRTGNARTSHNSSYVSNVEDEREPKGNETLARTAGDTLVETKVKQDTRLQMKEESAVELSLGESSPAHAERRSQQHQQAEGESAKPRPKLQRDESLKNLTEQIQQAVGRDVDDFKSAREMQNNLYWQKVASYTDEGARIILPATFALFLAILFAQRP